MPSNITEDLSTYDSRDGEQEHIVQNDESDEVSDYNRSISLMYV